jgi:hypothetical protein
MLDVGVDRRDVQIAAHPNYILAAYMASGT